MHADRDNFRYSGRGSNGKHTVFCQPALQRSPERICNSWCIRRYTRIYLFMEPRRTNQRHCNRIRSGDLYCYRDGCRGVLVNTNSHHYRTDSNFSPYHYNGIYLRKQQRKCNRDGQRWNTRLYIQLESIGTNNFYCNRIGSR